MARLTTRSPHCAVLENHFDEWIAANFARLWPDAVDPATVDPAVALLADLAGDAAVLEFGVGTGRIALPLCRRGVRVHGVDLSAAMIERLHEQPGGDAVETTVGDFATTQVPGPFGLAYLVANTIMNLTTQDQQVQAFVNAAAHLDPGGRFVVEVIVPPWQRLPLGERFLFFDRTEQHIGFDEIDVATQNSWSHHYWFLDGETKTFSPPFRYVWPSELDLMARIAGMTLTERWSDWNRAPFTNDSGKHISIWQKQS